MGCNNSKQYDPHEEIDLEKINTSGFDKFKKFEYTLPFPRMLDLAFEDNIRKAQAADGDQGFVTFDSLRIEFDTSAWQVVHKEHSVITRCLKRPFFQF